MEKYSQDILKECELRGLSEDTKKAYTGTIQQFAKFHSGRDPESLGITEIKAFLYHQHEGKKLSGISVNRSAAAIRFYYFKVLERDWKSSLIPRYKAEKSIPVILSKDEILRMVRATKNLKHKAMVLTLYSTGIRMRELLTLKPEDIDSQRMVINIRAGKGKKDRQAILSPHLLKLLREYWVKCPDNKSVYLFPASAKKIKNKLISKRLSHTSIDYVVKNCTVFLKWDRNCRISSS
jgi:site-specific recombinase XerD